MLISHLFEEPFGAFLFLFLSFLAPSLEDLGVLMIFERKSLLQKFLFKWLQHTSGGRIFWSGVMHANMAKP
jgi:hypothetical protein